MGTRSFLMFDLDGMRFGVDAAQVRESIWLPELALVEESPPWVAGVFSLRGCIVAVCDLRSRFGHPARAYEGSDRVLVLEVDDRLFGIVASDVIDVVDIPQVAIQPPPRFDGTDEATGYLVFGEARVGDEIVTLLDAAQLATAGSLPTGAAPSLQPRPGTFCPQASEATRALLHARAATLATAPTEEAGARLGVAVVELGGERFGIELSSVREFCNVGRLARIPCCPPHILGAMNLRGNLITLVDPRAALNLPTSGTAGSKAVIGQIGEQDMAIAVDAVGDVIYLRADDLLAPPAALRDRFGAELTGVAHHADGMIAMIDLPLLLARDEWIVDENM